MMASFCSVLMILLVQKRSFVLVRPLLRRWLSADRIPAVSGSRGVVGGGRRCCLRQTEEAPVHPAAAAPTEDRDRSSLPRRLASDPSAPARPIPNHGLWLRSPAPVQRAIARRRPDKHASTTIGSLRWLFLRPPMRIRLLDARRWDEYRPAVRCARRQA